MSETETTTITYSIDPETRVLMQVPCWQSHSRGKNWMAAITRDATKPNGLERSFFPLAKGDGYYYLGDASIAVAHPVPFAVEFGADYYSARGKADRTRVYGVVTAIRPDGLDFAQTDTTAQACRLAKRLREEHADALVSEPEPERDPLEDYSSEVLLEALVLRGALSYDVESGAYRVLSLS